MPLRFLPLLLLVVTPAASLGQAVHGVVRDAGSRSPIEGAVVSLLDAGGVQRVGTLTDGAGRYSLNAPAPGSYVVRAERIGYRSVASAPLSLAAGQRLEHDISAFTEAIQLSGIHVESDRRCVVRPVEGLRAATLWDEARKALNAVAITQDQGLVRYRIRRYDRDLDRQTLVVTSESATQRMGYGNRPFESLPAAELARKGFVVEERGERVYYAPDAQVLLSDEFLDTHCFRTREGTGEEDGLVGLAFEPVRRRSVVDIRGVLWLDPASAELRHVEYQYTDAPSPEASANGGRVEYERLPGGAWIVRRWWIRMPLIGREPGRGQDRVIAVRETGGEVDQITTARGGRVAERGRPTLEGTVYDSIAGAPLAGATVYLSGTSHSAVTDEQGAFRMDDLPEGDYAVGILHARLDSLGFVLPPRPVTLAAGRRTATELAIPSLANALAAICRPRQSRHRAGVLVGVVTDRATGARMPGARVALSWKTASGAPGTMAVAADREGRYWFCTAPEGVSLEVRAEAPRYRVEPQPVRLAAGAPTRLDLGIMPVPRTVVAASGGGAERVLVQGRVLDASTGAPVAGALVRLDGAEGGQVTDAQGRFRLDGLAPGPHTLSVRHLGYDLSGQAVELAAGGNEVEIRVPPRALALEGIAVSVVSRTELAERARTTSLYRVSGTDLREMERRGTRMEEVIRSRLPLRITPLQIEGMPMPGLCVEPGRGSSLSTGATSVHGSTGEACNMIQVVVDDVVMPDPGLFLRNLSLTDIESVEWLPAVEAVFRWGPRAKNGALVITTRGR